VVAPNHASSRCAPLPAAGSRTWYCVALCRRTERARLAERASDPAHTTSANARLSVQQPTRVPRDLGPHIASYQLTADQTSLGSREAKTATIYSDKLKPAAFARGDRCALRQPTGVQRVAHSAHDDVSRVSGSQLSSSCPSLLQNNRDLCARSAWVRSLRCADASTPAAMSRPHRLDPAPAPRCSGAFTLTRNSVAVSAPIRLTVGSLPWSARRA